jgi:hypothetical protein
MHGRGVAVVDLAHSRITALSHFIFQGAEVAAQLIFRLPATLATTLVPLFFFLHERTIQLSCLARRRGTAGVSSG